MQRLNHPTDLEDWTRESVLEEEFRPDGLRDRIVEGAVCGDLVRLHGAIVAALELYPLAAAVGDVFAPALTMLGSSGVVSPAGARAGQAIADHLRAWKQPYPA